MPRSFGNESQDDALGVRRIAGAQDGHAIRFSAAAVRVKASSAKVAKRRLTDG